MTKAYSIAYHTKDEPGNWINGITTDADVWSKILDLQTSDATGMPQFKASADMNDHGTYEAAKEKMIEQGGIAKTSKGEISGDCE